MASTFAVIGPSMNENRGPPAFFFFRASKVRSLSHSSSTPCSSSGRSKDDPTGVKRVFSFVVAISCSQTKRRPAPGTALPWYHPSWHAQRAPTHRLANGVALRPGLVASRFSSGGIGVDRPSNASHAECTGPSRPPELDSHLPRERPRDHHDT